MARRRYLIAYDIREPRRLRRVADIMETFGYRAQYSLFVCDLSRAEIAMWRNAILTVVELAEDSVMIVPLGPPESADISYLGQPPPEIPSGPVIV